MSPRATVIAIALATPLSLCMASAVLAAERPGGGSSFSGSRSSSSRSSGSSSSSRSSSSSYRGGGGSYSGGGGSGYRGYGEGGDLGPTGFLLTIGLGAIALAIHAFARVAKEEGWSSGGYDEDTDYAELFSPTPVPSQLELPKPKPVSLEPLRDHDPNFSRILLEDFLYELYTRAQESRTSPEDLDLLAPYLDAKVRQELATRGRRKTVAVGGVIVGSMRVAKLEQRDGWDAIEVEYEANYTEAYAAGDDPMQSSRLGFYAKERWHFVRKQGVESRKPDETRSFNCPSCGAPVEQSQDDTCSYCGVTHGTGDFDWLCNGLAVTREETRGPTLTGYAPEEGTYDPTVLDAQRDQQLASLQALDPEFDRTRFLARVEMIYHELNEAWSSLEWERARPFLSDRLWLSMRYWIHAYEEQNLRNQMLGAKVDRQEIAKVEVDPFFHSITVRVWASAIDQTVHRHSGAVVGGDPHTPRDYSEYWTLIRSAQRRGPASVAANCPSCGAALQINMAGSCESCGVKVTSGQFDWVLSKIEQDEAYLG